MSDQGGMFRHAVASGDPLQDRVVIWTRVSTDGDRPIELHWTMGRDPGLSQVVASGSATADLEADFTVRADVTGLEPDTHYFYRFEAAGQRSPVGRTRTLPASTDHLRFAAVSCAKFNAGYLNAYGRI